MKRSSLYLSAIALLICVAQATASINGYISGQEGDDPPYTVGSGWQSFVFLQTGSFNVEGPWTFSSAGNVDLKVTDAFLYGDQFNVYDNAVLLGATSVPSGSGGSASDGDTAYGDPGYSKGLFVLGAGSHSVTFEAIQSPFGAGGAFFRVDESAAAVPEPATLTIWGLGALGCAFAAYRRKRLAS